MGIEMTTSIADFFGSASQHFSRFDYLNKIPLNGTVLFICVGNINRSPAAELMMKDQLISKKLGWKVLSAGISDKNKGKMTAKKMRDILTEMGYEENSVRSQPVTQELVDQADVIFVMDGANERKLVEKFGEQILSKIQYIGDWNAHSSRTIPDPHFHSGSEEHRKVAYLLEGSIHNLIGYHETMYNLDEPLKGN